jgi:restriction system protein
VKEKGDLMTRYWVIAPFHADMPELWEKVWQFDLHNNLISVGWRELGDISCAAESDLKAAIDRTYPDRPPAAKKLYFRMLRDFYHSVKPGDLVIARRGTKKIAAVGTVTRAGYYELNKNAAALGPERAYSNNLDVHWADAPRDKQFDVPVFGMQTIYEIDEDRFRQLSEGQLPAIPKPPSTEQSLRNEAEFVLEKYLEEFIVSNFDAIFGGKLHLYRDAREDITGQQFATDIGVIDILAQEPHTNSFVVI